VEKVGTSGKILYGRPEAVALTGSPAPEDDKVLKKKENWPSPPFTEGEHNLSRGELEKSPVIRLEKGRHEEKMNVFNT